MNIDQIIGKLMGADSVEKENPTLETWKKEAEDNIKALEDIQNIASLSNSLNGNEDFGVDEAWHSFSATMDSDKQTNV